MSSSKDSEDSVSIDYDGYDLIDEQLFIHHGTRHCPESKQPTQNVENEVFITVGGALWRVYVTLNEFFFILNSIKKVEFQEI